jgi:putative FmdB family regulatory protein
MPLYEYRCIDCGKEFEVMQKFSDEAVSECIDCSGPVEKLISRSSFHLKGGGWHADGYSKGAGGAGGGTVAAGEKEDKPSECKEAKKPECAGCPSAS